MADLPPPWVLCNSGSPGQLGLTSIHFSLFFFSFLLLFLKHDLFNSFRSFKFFSVTLSSSFIFTKVFNHHKRCSSTKLPWSTVSVYIILPLGPCKPHQESSAVLLQFWIQYIFLRAIDLFLQEGKIKSIVLKSMRKKTRPRQSVPNTWS